MITDFSCIRTQFIHSRVFILCRNFRFGYYPTYLQNYYFKAVENDESFDPIEIQWSKYYLEKYWQKESRHCKVHWLHNLNNVRYAVLQLPTKFITLIPINLILYCYRIPSIYETYFTPNNLSDYTKLEPKEEFKKLKILDIGCGGGICSEVLICNFVEINNFESNSQIV